MTKLCKFTYDAYRWLARNVERNIEYYTDPHADFPKLLIDEGSIKEYKTETDITIKGSIDLKPPINENKRHTADIQALDFYNALEGMTPRTATEPEILAYINHVYLHKYGVYRWPPRKSNTLVANIEHHWLTKASERTKIYRESISGRTWWIAHIATVAAEASNGAFDAEQALEVFVGSPEYYHRTMEYRVLYNPTTMAECIRSLLNEARGINRNGYREMAQEINREAGARILDTLPQPDVRTLIRRAADRQMCRPESVSDRKYLKGTKKCKVLSLGAGTQSTVLALMAEQGWGGLEKPDLAIFADTKWEPPQVYEHLDWLEKQLSYKVLRVSAGDIRENVLNGVTPDGNKFLDMPVFLINTDGTKSVAARQCTTHYKIKPIHRELRKVLELEPGKRAPMDKQVEMWIGISVDEVRRMKPSRDEWITNRFPLVDLGLTRAQLYSWFKERYPDRYLPRSACIGCPYHTNMEWKWLKENDPKSFQDAVFIDKAIREVPHIRGTLRGEGYLHKERKSLDAVDFSQTESYEDFMVGECEGMCGV
ncbi:MAG: hypothetical protein F4W68_06470 [Cenarchaeum sp. SB0661_bin_35]|nr:hypothetical protein [Cenarchaeum sp. SB0661_bin_35]